MPKYTESEDGKMRCTIIVKFRLSKEWYDLLEKYSEEEDFNGVDDVIRCEGSLAVEALIHDILHGGRP